MMYDYYRQQALAEIQQQADDWMRNFASEYDSALALGRDPDAAYAAYAQKVAQLEAQIADQAAAIDAEYNTKEAEHAYVAAIPLRGGASGTSLVPQSLSTPYQVSAPNDDDPEPDESGESLLSSLLSWFK